MANEQIREDFEDYQILEGTIKTKDSTAIPFGPLGTMEAESEVEEIVKKAEGKKIKSKKRVSNLNVTVTGHATVPAQRTVFGLSTEGFKKGVYGYGTLIKSQPLIFTAVVIDMDGNRKYIAFPNMEDVKGLTINIDNDQTEIKMNEMEFSANADENNQFYYEAYESELDEAAKTAWLTNFTPELVKSTN